ncbi:MAG TPA: hypothetical protein VGM36_04055 [Rhizomicrobium sp.]|jgi:N-acyl-D-aspartate/D-glutamate deacylase
MIVLQYIAAALAALDEILKAGGNVTALVTELKSTIQALQAENRDPTEEEWAAMNTQIAAAIAALG